MNRRAQRAELRRQEILDTSMRIFAEKGYHATGIADIADELAMGHGTFYRYFKNKHDIALHAFDRVMMQIAEAGLSEDPASSASAAEYREQTARILGRMLALAEEKPYLLRFFHEQAVVIDVARYARAMEEYVAYTGRFLQNGVKKSFLRKNLDVSATAEMLVALIFEGTRRALLTPDRKARLRWVEAGMALMFDGILAR